MEIDLFWNRINGMVCSGNGQFRLEYVVKGLSCPWTKSHTSMNWMLKWLAQIYHLCSIRCNINTFLSSSTSSKWPFHGKRLFCCHRFFSHEEIDHVRRGGFMAGSQLTFTSLIGTEVYNIMTWKFLCLHLTDWELVHTSPICIFFWWHKIPKTLGQCFFFFTNVNLFLCLTTWR